jgi:hypothetical protein
MARSRYRLTPALLAQIVAFIRGGGFPHIAAEAAGLPRQVFARWLQRGQRADAPPNYRAFALAVMEAQAQARLHAELATLTDKPLDWLKAGPGKDSADNPGWTNPGKPRAASAGWLDREQILVELFALLGECAEQLAPCPEARAFLAGWLANRLPDRRQKES